MNNYRRFFFHLAFFLSVLSFWVRPDHTYAVAANPDPVVYTQPDGSKLTILLRGDEFIHWAVTTDGYTIMTNTYGAYEYAVRDKLGRLALSGIQANDPGKRNRSEKSLLGEIEKELFFSSAQISEMKDQLAISGAPPTPLMGGFPSGGTRKLLMILANFSNTTTTFNQDNFNNFMNQPDYNNTGSFRDYYIEVSYGQLVVNTTVTVWVTLPNTHDHYGPQSNWGQFAYDAIVAADNQTSVNFSEFDNDMNGIADGVAIIHQGQGQEETGNTLDIWSHSWDLTSAGYSDLQRTFDGVLVDAYTTMPEKNATGMGTIGVICHEFCHNLGSPDFYDTDYGTGGSYLGTGKWDLMAGGSWNGNAGTKPAHPNAWIKAYFNWTSPVVLNSVQNVTLRNAQVFPDAIRFNSQTQGEYFLCENRQQTGFDAGLPGHGLVIYHVDGNYIASHMNSNNINASSHQGLYPVCASATGNPAASYGSINGTGCPFPGAANKASFSDVTTPHSHAWSGTSTNCPVNNIFEYPPTHEVIFCFISCSTPDDPAGFVSIPYSTSQIDLSWGLNSMNSPVMIACSMTPSFGDPAAGMVYLPGESIPGGGMVICNGTTTSFSHTGLNTSTTYYYKAWSILSGNNYSMGVVSRATTFCGLILSLPWYESFENAGLMPGCWMQEQINNSGINWIFPAGNGSSNPTSAHSGTYNACLKDKTVADNRSRLISPGLDLSSAVNPQLSFWHTQPVWGSDQDQLSVYYKTSSAGPWIQLASYISSIASWTQETISLPNQTATYYIAFEGNVKFGYGICIDDIEVANGCTTYVPVSISISTTMNPACSGMPVSDTAIAFNGGTSPAFQWKIGGTDVTGATDAAFSHVPAGNEEVTCVLTSNAACTMNSTAVSNVIARVINPSLTASITINASVNPVVPGEPVTLTASPVNGGTAPVYQWNVNGTDVPGAYAPAYSYSPADADIVSCTMLSNAGCIQNNPANSNPVTISVTNVPAITTLQDQIISDVRCFNAVQSVIVAGGGSAFTVESGGAVTIIAGEIIRYLPGTTVEAGGYMLGQITITGEFCSSPNPALPGAAESGDGAHDQFVKPSARVYPNPTAGELTVEMKNSFSTDEVLVDIYGMQGNKVHSAQFTGGTKGGISLAGQPAGIYLVKVVMGKISETARIIKR